MKIIIISFFLILGSISNSFGLGLVQANNFVDMPFGSYTPSSSTSNLTATSNFSIVIVSLLGPITMTFTSGNASGTIFRVKNSSGSRYIPYALTFYTSSGGGGTAYTMNSGVSSSSLSILTLGIPLTVSMRVTFIGSNLQAAGAGTYSDTLSITVAVI